MAVGHCYMIYLMEWGPPLSWIWFVYPSVLFSEVDKSWENLLVVIVRWIYNLRIQLKFCKLGDHRSWTKWIITYSFLSQPIPTNGYAATSRNKHVDVYRGDQDERSACKIRRGLAWKDRSDPTRRDHNGFQSQMRFSELDRYFGLSHNALVKNSSFGGKDGMCFLFQNNSRCC